MNKKNTEINYFNLAFNCVNNKMFKYDWFVNSPYLWLNWLFQVQTVRLQTFVIVQA